MEGFFTSPPFFVDQFDFEWRLEITVTPVRDAEFCHVTAHIPGVVAGGHSIRAAACFAEDPITAGAALAAKVRQRFREIVERNPGRGKMLTQGRG